MTSEFTTDKPNNNAASIGRKASTPQRKSRIPARTLAITVFKTAERKPENKTATQPEQERINRVRFCKVRILLRGTEARARITRVNPKLPNAPIRPVADSP